MEELVPISRLFCVKGERRFYAKAIRQDGFYCIVDQVHKLHMETRVFRHERNCARPDSFASPFSFLFFSFSNICLLLTPNYGKIYLVHKSIMRYKIYEIYYHYC